MASSASTAAYSFIPSGKDAPDRGSRPRLRMPKPARVTLQTIADMTGVSKSTVCDVLRKRQGKIQVPDATKQRIFEAVQRTGYQPRASAQALATGKSNQIGFLVSAKMTLGLANSMFATMMSGAQEACKRFDYACLVSAYDLSSVNQFVVPRNIRSRKVDGLVLCGYVEDQVLQKLVNTGTPFVLIGMSTDYPRDNILAAMIDVQDVWMRCFEGLYAMGHRHIGVGGVDSDHSMKLIKQVFDRFQSKHGDVRFTSYGINRDIDQFSYAYERSAGWVAAKDRPTAVTGHEHWCMGFLARIHDAGFNCPNDVSVVCTVESPYAQWMRPAMSALSPNVFAAADAATQVLIELLEEQITWSEAKRRTQGLWPKPELIYRASTAPPASVVSTP